MDRRGLLVAAVAASPLARLAATVKRFMPSLELPKYGPPPARLTPVLQGADWQLYHNGSHWYVDFLVTREQAREFESFEYGSFQTYYKVPWEDRWKCFRLHGQKFRGALIQSKEHPGMYEATLIAGEGLDHTWLEFADLT